MSPGPYSGLTGPWPRDPTTGALLVSGSGGSTPYGLAIGRGGCLVPVGLRGQVVGDNASAAADTSQTARFFVPLSDSSVTQVLPIFTNIAVSAQGALPDMDPSSPVTLAASVEMDDGTIVPLTFNGQRTIVLGRPTRDGTVPPVVVPDNPVSIGAQVSATDKFSVVIPRKGFWMRTYVSVPASRVDTAGTTSSSPTVTDTSILAADAGRPVSGTGIPANTFVGTVTAGVSFLLSSRSDSQNNVNATVTNASASLTIGSRWAGNIGNLTTADQITTTAGADLTPTGSGSVSGGATTYYVGPAVVLGRAQTRRPIVALISDSILDGYSDDFHSLYQGAVARACIQLGYPLVKLSRGGESALAWTTSIGRRYRGMFLDGCTHALVQLGTNDQSLTVGAGAGGVTTMQTRLAAIGTYLTAMGIKPYLATVPPRTTSSDAWATTVNQTPTSGSQITSLASLNQSIRAGLSPYLDIYDLEGACSSAQDSGLWAVGKTSDGVHPNDTVARGAMTTAAVSLLTGWSV